jgi:hypothetical protein
MSPLLMRHKWMSAEVAEVNPAPSLLIIIIIFSFVLCWNRVKKPQHPKPPQHSSIRFTKRASSLLVVDTVAREQKCNMARYMSEKNQARMKQREVEECKPPYGHISARGF